MHPLEYQTLRRLGDQLPHSCRQLVVAVSGGADSTALLLVLVALRQSLGLSLSAMYVDHGLRPRETPAERGFVGNLAGLLGVAYHIAEVDARAHAKAQKMSLEHACRELRYRALRSLVTSDGLIAVAHTADDQVENILLRLFRGGGGRALSGMRLLDDGILRPFLACRKETLLSYLRDKQTTFCEDSSNRSPHFLRNRVRHTLLPFLEKEFGLGVRQALLKSSANLAVDEELLQRLTAAALPDAVQWVDGGQSAILNKAPFLRLDQALQRRVLEVVLCRLAGRAAHLHILQLLQAASHGKAGSELHLSKGLRAIVSRDSIAFVYPRGRLAWRGSSSNRDGSSS